MNTKTPIRPLTRKQAKEALETMPLDALLGSGVSRELTPKQRKFARSVAAGATKADAYRGSYNVKSKATMTSKPYALARDDRVKAEIEAFKLAQAAQEYRSPAALRALVIQTLVEVATNGEEKAAVRVQAAKVLGTVVEVGAFVHRTEVKHIGSSEETRAKIMRELKTLMLNTGEAVDVEALSLLDELQTPVESPETRDYIEGDNAEVLEQDDSGPDDDGAAHDAAGDAVQNDAEFWQDSDPTRPPPAFVG